MFRRVWRTPYVRHVRNLSIVAEGSKASRVAAVMPATLVAAGLGSFLVSDIKAGLIRDQFFMGSVLGRSNGKVLGIPSIIMHCLGWCHTWMSQEVSKWIITPL